MIKRSIHTPQSPMRRSVNAASITAGVQNRRNSAVNASVLSTLNPAQKAFVAQLRRNCTKPSSIMAATNTTNISSSSCLFSFRSFCSLTCMAPSRCVLVSS